MGDRLNRALPLSMVLGTQLNAVQCLEDRIGLASWGLEAQFPESVHCFVLHVLQKLWGPDEFGKAGRTVNRAVRRGRNRKHGGK